MVLMMTFRPQGIIPYVRRTYEFHFQGDSRSNNEGRS
jgi:hypothetical protein